MHEFFFFQIFKNKLHYSNLSTLVNRMKILNKTIINAKKKSTN